MLLNNRIHPFLRRTPVRGVTLIELLVVVSILMILAAAMIPRIKPAMENVRTREAARSVDLYLNSARNQAMATGRNCGVMIERLVNRDAQGKVIPVEPNCSMTLTQVETPVTYRGDSLNSTAKVSFPFTPANPPGLGLPNLSCIACDIAIPERMSGSPPYSPSILQGDLIQFNNQGPWFTIFASDTSETDPNTGYIISPILHAYFDTTLGGEPFWAADPSKWFIGDVSSGGGSGPTYRKFLSTVSSSTLQTFPNVGFAIIRWPTKSSTAALQLPSPAVIDLTASGGDSLRDPTAAPSWGLASGASLASQTKPVTIMFSANGSIDRYYFNGQAANPIAPLYLLIGKRNQVGDPAPLAPPKANIDDMTNLWVAINPRTGLVVTTDMYLTTGLSGVNELDASRQYARQSDAMGGK